MSERRIAIIVNGATGRMARNQHLANALVAIRDSGGLSARRRHATRARCARGRTRRRTVATAGRQLRIPDAWSTDLDAALASERYGIYFDGVTTALRPDNLRRAIAAGKHVYSEKPIAKTAAEADDIAALANKKGIRHGVVHDKLWAPACANWRMLARSGFFGRILTARIEGCYWVFEGDLQPIQRPSWNYRASEGGGMILDMMPHYRCYMIESIVAPIRRIVFHGVTHVQQRWDENGKAVYGRCRRYMPYAILELEGGVGRADHQLMVRARATRRHHHDADRRHGRFGGRRAVALLDPAAYGDAESAVGARRRQAGRPFRADWQLVPETEPYVNAFRAQWDLFLRHVAEGRRFHGRSIAAPAAWRWPRKRSRVARTEVGRCLRR